MFINFGGIRNFRFDAYYINVCVIFDDFLPIVEKNHRLERAQYAFLDHSKTLVLVTSSK